MGCFVSTEFEPREAKIESDVSTSAKQDAKQRCKTARPLVNLGNTCFMNAALQCLSNTESLREYFASDSWKEDVNEDNPLGMNGDIARAYAQVIQQLWATNSVPPYNPKQLKSKIELHCPIFEGNEQHDAQELLAFLLDGLHEDLNRVTKKPYVQDIAVPLGKPHEIAAAEAWRNHLLRNKSIIVDLFQGQTRSTLACSTCQYQSVKFEPFMSLSLPLDEAPAFEEEEEEAGVGEGGGEEGKAEGGGAGALQATSLDQCMASFLKAEELRGEEQWYCPACQQHREAHKKFDLWKLPPILMVHLKRFKVGEGGACTKIDRTIRFPLKKWELQQQVVGPSSASNQCTYDLHAVLRHSGGLTSGHYTAAVHDGYDKSDEGWYVLDDAQKRRPVEPAQVVDSSAYCLFFTQMVRNATPETAAAGQAVGMERGAGEAQIECEDDDSWVL
jgi:ubiquitin carboxyl-terminal hydrolase 8